MADKKLSFIPKDVTDIAEHYDIEVNSHFI
jgi:hypothetical protein